MKKIFLSLSLLALAPVCLQAGVRYESIYDPVADKGQYWWPDIGRLPAQYWECTGIANNQQRNALGESDPLKGLQYHLLCESIQGLVNRAMADGQTTTGVMMYAPNQLTSTTPYSLARDYFASKEIKNLGRRTGIELAGDKELRKLFKGYVLCDVEHNPESGNVATVASFVYDGIIVDVRDRALYEKMGYKMLYDATRKSTADAWREMGSKCSRKGLVLMPVGTAELREMAIAHGFFVINLNKEYGDSGAGDNTALFEEVLTSLEPGSPVFGWEHGVVGEHVFVGRVTKAGCRMIPFDWVYNTTLISACYPQRQTQSLCPVINPAKIDYTKQKKFVSFYLSDGDNVMFTAGRTFYGFVTQPAAKTVKMAFGLPVTDLPLYSPGYFSYLLGLLSPENTVVENFGGGYYYANLFDANKPRAEALRDVAEKTAIHMRQHRDKIMSVISYNNILDSAAHASCQAYVDANDQLEGIIAIQYGPYSGGKGEIYWCTNKKGIDIPVVTMRYTLWNFGERNNPNDGTPAYIARKIDGRQDDFSAVGVHCWSKFTDIGKSNDLLAENADGGKVQGADAALMCMRRFDKDVEVVSLQELFWRVRMKYRPEQTKAVLKEYK